ncbi:hypothetical protein EPI10_002701 [Gossypium australe]|uniref:Uncharacterized protein n=1 Tax=Gossypium australe TaxID=47621 RepID=A0A5B6VF10_9ROSI|nr:hypothetical protein EPI10_002701 [Gossypium australe]
MVNDKNRKKSSPPAERCGEIQEHIDTGTYSEETNNKHAKLFTFMVQCPVSNPSSENMYGYRRQA